MSRASSRELHRPWLCGHDHHSDHSHCPPSSPERSRRIRAIASPLHMTLRSIAWVPGCFQVGLWKYSARTRDRRKRGLNMTRHGGAEIEVRITNPRNTHAMSRSWRNFAVISMRRLRQRFEANRLQRKFRQCGEVCGSIYPRRLCRYLCVRYTPVVPICPVCREGQNP